MADNVEEKKVDEVMASTGEEHEQNEEVLFAPFSPLRRH